MSTTPIKHQCNFPSHTLTIDYQGNILLCDCDGWLPIPVGRVQDFDTIEQIFSSDIARALQKDVSDKYFSWCAVDHCGIRNRNQIKTQTTIAINIDESCNLACPSCRRSQIMISSGPEFDKKINQVNRIINWLTIYDQPLHVILSGNGDPLASQILRPIVKTYQPQPNQTFTLFTNGLLIKKQVNIGMPIFDHITTFRISVDAGSQEVYEDVRRPGKWSVLIENFEYLTRLGKQNKVYLNFALQSKNYRDLPNFISWCQHYGFNASIHQLDDWGTWNSGTVEKPDTWTITNGIYLDHAVLKPSHALHQECLTVLTNIQKQNLPFVTFSAVVKKLLLTDTV